VSAIPCSRLHNFTAAAPNVLLRHGNRCVPQSLPGGKDSLQLGTVGPVLRPEIPKLEIHAGQRPRALVPVRELVVGQRLPALVAHHRQTHHDARREAPAADALDDPCQLGEVALRVVEGEAKRFPGFPLPHG
jgi:hypothetical protein